MNPTPQRKPGRPPLYHWDVILDFEDFADARKQLLPDRDFDKNTKLESFRTNLLVQAKKRGIRIATRRMGDGIGVYLLAGDPGTNRDWDTLFDGEQHWLVRYADFNGAQHEVVDEVMRAAEARGIEVRVRALEDRVGVRARLNTPTERVSS